MKNSSFIFSIYLVQLVLGTEAFCTNMIRWFYPAPCWVSDRGELRVHPEESVVSAGAGGASGPAAGAERIG